jgi:hypothetical protein
MPTQQNKAISTNTLKKEEATLRVTLAGNGYPPKCINKGLSQRQKQKPNNQDPTKGTVVVPYIQRIVDKLDRTGIKFRICEAFI